MNDSSVATDDLECSKSAIAIAELDTDIQLSFVEIIRQVDFNAHIDSDTICFT